MAEAVLVVGEGLDGLDAQGLPGLGLAAVAVGVLVLEEGRVREAGLRRPAQGQEPVVGEVVAGRPSPIGAVALVPPDGDAVTAVQVVVRPGARPASPRTRAVVEEATRRRRRVETGVVVGIRVALLGPAPMAVVAVALPRRVSPKRPFLRVAPVVRVTPGGRQVVGRTPVVVARQGAILRPRPVGGRRRPGRTGDDGRHVGRYGVPRRLASAYLRLSFRRLDSTQSPEKTDVAPTSTGEGLAAPSC